LSASCHMPDGLQGEAPNSSQQTRCACTSGRPLVKGRWGGCLPDKLP
jgi:hypothetical protein